MLKKIISLVLSLAVIFTLGVSVGAMRIDNEVSPNYLYTGDVTCQLKISGGTESCCSNITGSKSVTKIVGSQYLEKKNSDGDWETVTGCSWSKTANSRTLKLENTKSGLDSGTYRLRAVFTVYSGSNSEPVEKTSKEVTVA